AEISDATAQLMSIPPKTVVQFPAATNFHNLAKMMTEGFGLDLNDAKLRAQKFIVGGRKVGPKGDEITYGFYLFFLRFSSRPGQDVIQNYVVNSARYAGEKEDTTYHKAMIEGFRGEAGWTATDAQRIVLPLPAGTTRWFSSSPLTVRYGSFSGQPVNTPFVPFSLLEWRGPKEPPQVASQRGLIRPNSPSTTYHIIFSFRSDG